MDVLQTSRELDHRIVMEAHSNRIFSLQFSYVHNNTLVSGGWDNTVQIWDLRDHAAVRHISGPHIAGDSVDLWDEVVVTGSYSGGASTLQTWDLNTTELISTLPWGGVGLSRLYTACFSKVDGAEVIAAGGADHSEAKIFSHETGQATGSIWTGSPVYSTHFHPSARELAVATADGRVLLVPYPKPDDGPLDNV